MPDATTSAKARRIKAAALPRRGTRAAESFFASYSEINRFFRFVIHLVGHTDRAAETAHKALVETEHDEAKRQEMITAWARRQSATDALRENRQLFLEIVLVRHVENFLNYLAALLYEIFTQRPETLRSSDRVEVANVLRHESIESLVREIAERKVESLSYSSFQDVADFFQERFKISVADPAPFAALLEAIETRNISVHNRCVMNRRFVIRLGLEEDAVGKRRELYIAHLDSLVPLLATVVRVLDRRAASKLRLRGVRFARGFGTRKANRAMHRTRPQAAAPPAAGQ